ncbi:MAG: ferric reductase-like transmembrane domain-containing protein [Thermoleophilia bacterium]|nr:ferric reductase-like transmembrane domain-containing protein [Thermoleophilia bacterium]
MNTDPNQHLWWLASRSSGIVALVMLTATVMLGLMLGGKISQRLPKGLARLLGAEPRLISKAHEQLSVAALIAIGVHGVTLLGDTFIHPTLGQIAIPFTIGYRPLATGIGIVAGYIAAALGLSFYARKRIGVQTWRKLHRFTIVAYVMSVIHMITAGTDGTSPWLRTPVLASAALIAMLFAARVASARRGPASARAARVERAATA